MEFDNKVITSAICDMTAIHIHSSYEACRQGESFGGRKSNLQLFKKSNIHLSSVDHFWDVSDIIFSKLEGDCYSKNRKAHVDYLLENPKVALRRGINTN